MTSIRPETQFLRAVREHRIPRGTKILATLGPNSSSPEVLEELLRAGVDVVRINFSHGEPEVHRQTVERVRLLANRVGKTVAVLQDLQGPKIRVGRFREGQARLEPGRSFTLTTQSGWGDERQASVSHRGLPRDLASGQTILLDDGKLRLRVVEIAGEEVRTEVEIGGILSDNKGVNVPGADLSVPALTGQDLAHLRIGKSIGVDWVALSFVQNAEDVIRAREELAKVGSTAKLMAKIEKPRAVDRFDDILKHSDGIMVARGDLGVEMDPEAVPPVQKRLVRKSRLAGKPVVIATQMLESMIHASRPTRAEASDVANAIYDGADAVMLSAETAIGRYPVDAVRMMHQIATVVERTDEYRDISHAFRPKPGPTTQDVISAAACEVAESRLAAVIVVFTTSGSSAWRVARNRPAVPILALTTHLEVANQLALAFGVTSRLAPDPKDTDDMVRISSAKVVELGLAHSGDYFVITAGIPFAVSGTTNMLWVEQVP